MFQTPKLNNSTYGDKGSLVFTIHMDLFTKVKEEAAARKISSADLLREMVAARYGAPPPAKAPKPKRRTPVTRL